MRTLAATLAWLIPLAASAAAGDPNQAAPPRSFKDADLQSGPCPDFIPKGCQIAVLNGDPAKNNADVFFKVPGGVTYGQHFLNVKFADSTLRLPFRILTKDEEKLLEKHYKSIKKQVDEAFRPKKKS